MAVSCPEVMYGAYYPYLYGRAGPSRPFYQYERFNQELYSPAVPLTASSSASAGSHSPCSPLLPSAATASTSSLAGSSSNSLQQPNAANNLPVVPSSSSSSIGGNLSRAITKEEDLSGGRGGSDTDTKLSNWQSTSAGDAGDVAESKWSLGKTRQSQVDQVGGGHLKISLGVGGSGSSGSQQQQQQHQQQQHHHHHHHHHNESSCSSDPESQHGGEHSNDAQRAQYLSATCVVFTNYSGDVASVVDDHFTRALNFSEKESKEGSSPMSTRNFPPSFWDSNYVPPVPAHSQVADLYSTDGGYTTDPWVPHAAHYGSYAHAAHAHAAHAYHHNMAQYGSLLRLPQQYGHSSSFTNRLHHDQQTAHAFESAAAYSSYPSMAGLEAQVQESSKDLYWF